jgi:HK97 family phage prohead protease
VLSTTASPKKTLPRDDLFRGNLHGLEIREDGDDGMPVLYGHFCRFNEWTEINSIFEGRFLERIAPGSAKKTIKESRDDIRCLFQHGRDFQIGDKVLGAFTELKEDGTVGVYYEAPLFDTIYNRELVPGLEAGVYGASFRMRVTREEFDEEPGVSEHNPDGIPERTIKEFRLFEGGPVTFPAYKNATASVRSLTDEFVLQRFLRDPERLRELIDQLPEEDARDRLEEAAAERTASHDTESEQRNEDVDTGEAEQADTDSENAPPETDAVRQDTSEIGRREAKSSKPKPLYGMRQKTRKERPWTHR